MVEHSAAQLDAVFAALADPTRRAIVRRLSRRGRTVGDVAKPFQMSLQAVSKHLHVLERAGLIRRERRGREFQLELNAAPLRTVAQWVAIYQRFWEQKIDDLAAFVESEAAADAVRERKQNEGNKPDRASNSRESKEKK